MEATRIERIKRLAKKQAGLFDELQLNLDAELLRVTQYGAGDECAVAMSKAKHSMAESTYWLMQVLALAGEDELVKQMQISMSDLQAAIEDDE